MAIRTQIPHWQMSNWTKLALIAGLGLALSACQGLREATGVAKLAPDEFTVLTKAPLIVPPDYNLRPPQPGAADRNLSSPADMARNALFQQQDAATAAAQLGQDYSEGERLLLSSSGASLADPAIRQQIGIDSGQTDQGEAFARRVLFNEGNVPEPAVENTGGNAVVPAANVPDPPAGNTGGGSNCWWNPFCAR